MSRIRIKLYFEEAAYQKHDSCLQDMGYRQAEVQNIKSLSPFFAPRLPWKHTLSHLHIYFMILHLLFTTFVYDDSWPEASCFNVEREGTKKYSPPLASTKSRAIFTSLLRSVTNTPDIFRSLSFVLEAPMIGSKPGFTPDVAATNVCWGGNSTLLLHLAWRNENPAFKVDW